MEESTLMEETNNNRIQTRRASRSTRSASPVMTEADEEEGGIGSPVSLAENNNSGSNNISSANATATNSVNGGRVTRSQSVESSGYDTTDSRKRKRKTKDSLVVVNNKKRDMVTPPPIHSNSSTVTNLSQSISGNTKEDYERETRNTAQRMTKEAREAKKAQRDMIIKERLSELDKLEKAVKAGSHSEYHKLLGDIESKRTKMLNVAEMRRSLAEGNVTNFFNSQKYAAYSQYYWDKLALRRSMIQHVQHKINILEQEYYSNHGQSSLDDEHLSEWVPPDRPSMISSLTLGLSEEQVENDLELAKQEPSLLDVKQTPTLMHASPKLSPNNVRESSPPLDMLASLADRQYQKDFKQEPTEKSFTLPPLHPWRYDQQRPTLPT